MTKLIPRQYIPVLCVILSIVISVLDGTIMNVALPTLTEEFGIEPDTSIWIVNAYQMVIMMFLLIFSALGDIYGYRKIFLSGTFIFTVASGLCVLSINFPMLIVSRILQGIGAACVMSVNTALIRQIYPPHYLGRGMSYNAMAVAISSVAGPTIAGFILSSLSWHWLFAINLPFGIIALVLGTKYLPANIRNNKRKIDFWSCAGNALTFGLLIYAVEGFAHKESLGLITFLFIAFLVIGFLYIRKQLHTDTPLLPVDLLRIPLFTLSVTTSIGSFMAQMLAMVSLPFYLQDVMGFSPAEIGILITPWPLATFLIAPVAGRLVEKVHPGFLGAIGMLFFASGLLLLYFLPAHAGSFEIGWRIVLCGIGFGLFQTPNNFTLVSSAPAHRSGGASGMLGMARLVGQTVGTTSVAIVFTLMSHTDGAELCLLIGAIVALLAGVSSISRIGNALPATQKKK